LVGASSTASGEDTAIIQFAAGGSVSPVVIEEFVRNRPVERYRIVEIDADALRSEIRRAQEALERSDSPILELPLLDGAIVKVELRRTAEYFDSWQTGFATFSGALAGGEYSKVSGRISPDGSVSLYIHAPPDYFKIEPTSVLPFHVYWIMSPDVKTEID
jgi:hypothetical protein